MIYSAIAALLAVVSSTPIELSNAIKQKKIEFKIYSNDKSTHYHYPLIAEMYNNTSETIYLHWSLGEIFQPEDTTYQGFMTVMDSVFVLMPNRKVVLPLRGFCVNSSRVAPSGSIKYQYYNRANNHLAQLAKLIWDNKYFLSEAQYAVWNLTDKHFDQSLAGYNKEAQKTLAEFVAQVKSKPVEYFIEDGYMNDWSRKSSKVTVGGEFEWVLKKNTHIIIAMFDTQNRIVRELYNVKNVKPGKHLFKYEFDATYYTDDVYHFKFLEDGVVYADFKMEMNDWD